MNLIASIEKIIENVAFKRRQRQFCNFVNAVCDHNHHRVEKMLQHNPKLISASCLAPRGFVNVPNWIKMVNPLAMALVEHDKTPTLNKLKTVQVLLQYGANPLSPCDGMGSEPTLNRFLDTICDAKLLSPNTILHDICLAVFIKIDRDHMLQDVLYNSSTWRTLQKQDPDVCNGLIESVFTYKCEQTKRAIEQNLSETSDSLSRKSRKI